MMRAKFVVGSAVIGLAAGAGAIAKYLLPGGTLLGAGIMAAMSAVFAGGFVLPFIGGWADTGRNGGY